MKNCHMNVMDHTEIVKSYIHFCEKLVKYFYRFFARFGTWSQENNVIGRSFIYFLFQHQTKFPLQWTSIIVDVIQMNASIPD